MIHKSKHLILLLLHRFLHHIFSRLHCIADFTAFLNQSCNRTVDNLLSLKDWYWETSMTWKDPKLLHGTTIHYNRTYFFKKGMSFYMSASVVWRKHRHWNSEVNQRKDKRHTALIHSFKLTYIQEEVCQDGKLDYNWFERLVFLHINSHPKVVMIWWPSHESRHEFESAQLKE